jgi:hypothetical protein
VVVENFPYVGAQNPSASPVKEVAPPVLGGGEFSVDAVVSQICCSAKTKSVINCEMQKNFRVKLFFFQTPYRSFLYFRRNFEFNFCTIVIGPMSKGVHRNPEFKVKT